MSAHVQPEDNTITMLPGELIWNKALETTKLRLIVMIFAFGLMSGIVLTIGTIIVLAIFLGSPV